MGATYLFPYCASKAQETETKIGVCLVGLGNYSRGQLAPALELTKHCELRGIVTGSPGKIPVWREKYNIPETNVYNYENMHTIAENPDIDVVYIVLPTGLHAKYAIIAANAGKHVWCEKPMAKTVEECQAVIDACNKNEVKLAIGYRMQHEPNTQQFIAWAKEQPYGPIETVSAEVGYQMNPDPSSWRLSKALGGGHLYDLGVYSINGIRYAMQQEPIAVTASFINTRPELFKEVSEETNFTLHFPNGINTTGKVSARETVNHLKITCENGWYELDPFQAYSGINGTTSDGIKLTDDPIDQQARQMDNDALAILNNTEVRVPGIEGMKDIAILEAINQSAESGEMVNL